MPSLNRKKSPQNGTVVVVFVVVVYKQGKREQTITSKYIRFSFLTSKFFTVMSL